MGVGRLSLSLSPSPNTTRNSMLNMPTVTSSSLSVASSLASHTPRLASLFHPIDTVLVPCAKRRLFSPTNLVNQSLLTLADSELDGSLCHQFHQHSNILRRLLYMGGTHLCNTSIVKSKRFFRLSLLKYCSSLRLFCQLG